MLILAVAALRGDEGSLAGRRSFAYFGIYVILECGIRGAKAPLPMLLSRRSPVGNIS